MKDLSGYIESLLDSLKTSENVGRRVYLKEGTYIIEFTFYTVLYDIGTEDFITRIIKEYVDKMIDCYVPKGSIEYLIVTKTEPSETQKNL